MLQHVIESNIEMHPPLFSLRIAVTIWVSIAFIWLLGLFFPRYMETIVVLTKVALNLYGAFGYMEMLAAFFYEHGEHFHSVCLQFLSIF